MNRFAKGVSKTRDCGLSFLKNAVLGLGLGLTLTLTLTVNLDLTLTLTLNNPNRTITLTLKQHSLKKDRPRPRPPVCEENCGRGQAQSLWRFFLAKKRVVLRQDQ